jgi:hypothetical protein
MTQEYIPVAGEKPRPICCEPECVNPCKLSRIQKNGTRSWKIRCASHHDMLYIKSKKYKASKGNRCENYDGVVVGMPCSTNNKILPREALDVDHKDGDKQNDDKSNYWTLCKCCHATKTKNHGENKPRNKRSKYLPPVSQLHLLFVYD